MSREFIINRSYEEEVAKSSGLEFSTSVQYDKRAALSEDLKDLASVTGSDQIGELASLLRRDVVIPACIITSAVNKLESIVDSPLAEAARNAINQIKQL